MTPLTLSSLTAVILVSWWCFCILFSGVEPLNPIEWVRFGGGVQRALFWVEPWRVFTACFHHATLSHLLINVFLLSTITFLTATFLGHRTILLGFLLSSWTATAVTLSMTDAWLVGASGGIHGLLGLTAHRLTRTKDPKKIFGALILATVAVALGLFEKASLFSHLVGFGTGLGVSLLIGRARCTNVLYKISLSTAAATTFLWLTSVV
ncbi:MAG: rhomboid family intramembrane serine protease [Myxococcota bacterium]|nr:rhomboid family intramembrane serine protease [Myxococcota bacterium]